MPLIAPSAAGSSAGRPVREVLRKFTVPRMVPNHCETRIKMRLGKVMRVRVGLFALALVVSGCGPGTSGETPTATASAGGASASTAAKVAPLVIGITLFQTPNATDWWQAGVALAIDDLNAKGGVNGSPVRAQIEQFTDVAGSLTAAQKLISVEKAPFIIGVYTPAVLAQAESLKDKSVILINAAATAPGLRAFGGTNIFSAIPLGTDQFAALGSYAYKAGFRKLAVAVERSDMGLGASTVFTPTYKAAGGTVVGTVQFDTAAGDYRSQLLQIKEWNPDAVFLMSVVGDTGQILKQASELGLKTQWLMYEGSSSQAMIDVAGKGAEGVMLTAGSYDPTNGPSNMVQWANRFKARFNYLPNFYPAFIYDAVQVAAKAAETAKGNDVPTLIKTLKGIEFQGVAGQVKFDKDNMLTQPVRMMTVQNGKIVSCTTCPQP